jgi:predicted RNA-binding Zn-ribbon protein involved in translation (DUF1610 family)
MGHSENSGQARKNNRRVPCAKPARSARRSNVGQSLFCVERYRRLLPRNDLFPSATGKNVRAEFGATETAWQLRSRMRQMIMMCPDCGDTLIMNLGENEKTFCGFNSKCGTRIEYQIDSTRSNEAERIRQLIEKSKHDR